MRLPLLTTVFLAVLVSGASARMVWVDGHLLDTKPSAPFRPTHASECDEYQQRLTEIRRRIAHSHDRCLETYRGRQSEGSTCSVAQCQVLHTANEEIGSDPSYASCMQTVGEYQRQEANRRARLSARIIDEAIKATKTVSEVRSKGVAAHAVEKIHEDVKEAARTYGTENPDSTPELNRLKKGNERAYRSGVENPIIRAIGKQSTDAALARQGDALSQLKKGLHIEVGAPESESAASSPKKFLQGRENEMLFK